MPSPHFIVHDETDNVGVIVVENIRAGDALTGWTMTTDASPQLTAGADIPIGHKIALSDLASGATATKYGQDIGQLTANIARGDHVHTHNLKTKRW